MVERLTLALPKSPSGMIERGQEGGGLIATPGEEDGRLDAITRITGPGDVATYERYYANV